MMHFDNVEQARQQALAAMQSDDAQVAITVLAQSVDQFPHDGPLLFLYGSELAEQQRFDEALEQFSNAVFNAPEFHIARFQLTLLASTVARGDLVEQHLPILMELQDSHYLGYFANALAAVFAEEFDRAASLLQSGINANDENPSLNLDMQQMLQRLQQQHQTTSADKDSEASNSADEDLSTLTGSVLLDIYKNTH